MKRFLILLLAIPAMCRADGYYASKTDATNIASLFSSFSINYTDGTTNRVQCAAASVSSNYTESVSNQLSSSLSQSIRSASNYNASAASSAFLTSSNLAVSGSNANATAASSAFTTSSNFSVSLVSAIGNGLLTNGTTVFANKTNNLAPSTNWVFVVFPTNGAGFFYVSGTNGWVKK